MATFGNAGNVIVWEFSADIPGMFTPYSDKVSNYIEDEYLKDCRVKVELEKVEPSLKDYVLDLSCMMQLHLARNSKRQVRRQLYDMNSVIGNGIVWEWLTDIGWISYDVYTMTEIEAAFAKNKEELDLATLKYRLPNIVLIKKGYQKNKSSNFVRPIQRRGAAYKSSADLQQEAGAPTRIRANDLHPKNVPSSRPPPPPQMRGDNSASKKSAQVHGINPPSIYQLNNNQLTNTQSSAAAPISSGAKGIRANDLQPKNAPSSRPPPPPPMRGDNSASKKSVQVHGINPPSIYQLNHSQLTNTQSSAAAPISSGAKGPSMSKSPSYAVSKEKSNENSYLSKYCRTIEVAPDEDCAICLISLKDDSDGEDDDTMGDEDSVVELLKCKHSFHMSCMEAYWKQGNQNGCIQCPICKTIHGTKIGNQPPGNMTFSIDRSSSVAGYEGCGMITITYRISSGIQGEDGPKPNSHYTAYGFPRTAYLPANEKGLKVLKLLKIAWERKLIFTIDTSVTTGLENCVVWNEIHHKTSPRDNGSGHGFPDSKYLDNVLEELKCHGVVDEDE